MTKMLVILFFCAFLFKLTLAQQLASIPVGVNPGGPIRGLILPCTPNVFTYIYSANCHPRNIFPLGYENQGSILVTQLYNVNLYREGVCSSTTNGEETIWTCVFRLCNGIRVSPLNLGNGAKNLHVILDKDDECSCKVNVTMSQSNPAILQIKQVELQESCHVATSSPEIIIPDSWIGGVGKALDVYVEEAIDVTMSGLCWLWIKRQNDEPTIG